MQKKWPETRFLKTIKASDDDAKITMWTKEIEFLTTDHENEKKTAN